MGTTAVPRYCIDSWDVFDTDFIDAGLPAEGGIFFKKAGFYHLKFKTIITLLGSGLVDLDLFRNGELISRTRKNLPDRLVTRETVNVDSYVRVNAGDSFYAEVKISCFTSSPSCPIFSYMPFQLQSSNSVPQSKLEIIYIGE